MRRPLLKPFEDELSQLMDDIIADQPFPPPLYTGNTFELGKWKPTNIGTEASYV